MKNLAAFIFAMLAIFVVAGCSGVATDDDINSHVEIVNFADIDLYGLTLTISSPWEFQNLELFARLYMEANPSVTITIDNFGGSWLQYAEQAPCTVDGWYG